MGGLAPINEAAIEASRILRKLERRLRKLLASRRTRTLRLGTRKPKQLLTTLSNKAAPFLHRKKVGEETDDGGAGELWQREILMGEKCQPLDFSGVIHYDTDGNSLSGVPPRSPRRSSLLAKTSSFPAPLAENGRY